jgi:predicted Fe-S protein YdhL (DUF1289 family)
MSIMTIDLADPKPGDPDSVDTDPVESPCIRLCTLDDDDVCLGCFRSLAEICAWGTASNDQRRQVLIACELRQTASRQRA